MKNNFSRLSCQDSRIATILYVFSRPNRGTVGVWAGAAKTTRATLRARTWHAMSDLSSLFDFPTSPASPAIKPAHPLRWGAPSAAERGPVIASRDPALRNAIGTHAGGYGVYRALAIAAGALPRDHRPDLTDTAPADLIGPHPQWTRPDRIVSLDPWGHLVGEAFRERARARPRHPADHRGHPRAYRHAGGARRLRRRPHPRRRHHRQAERAGARHEGGDRPGLAPARRGAALRHRRAPSCARACTPTPAACIRSW